MSTAKIHPPDFVREEGSNPIRLVRDEKIKEIKEPKTHHIIGI